MDDLRNRLFYEQKNAYDLIDTAERIDAEKYCRAYMRYLNDSRTEREAVDNAILLAEKSGFVPYVPGMELKPGDKIYQNNRGKALMLAVMGRQPLSAGAVIAGAVKGNIDVHGPVILDTTAIVMGNIKSQSVQINNGAVIEGMCSQVYAEVNPSAFFENIKGQ